MSQSYFQEIRPVILKHLREADLSVEAAIAWFTDKDIFDVLIELLEKGVRVDVIITNDPINFKNPFDWYAFGDLGGEAYIYGDEKKTMHNKFCIIDGKTLLSGSYNWTYKAHKSNRENLMVFTLADQFDVKGFQRQFEEMMAEGVLITKRPESLQRQFIVANYLEIKDFMARMSYKGVSNKVRANSEGHLFLTFALAQGEQNHIYFSVKASSFVKKDQKVDRAFFDPLIIIIKVFELNEKPVVKISLREEFSV